MKNIGVIVLVIAAIAVIIVLGVSFVTLNSREDVAPDGEDIYSGSDISTDGETGAFNDMSFVIDDYTISIDSEEVGHPGPESYFNTDITIENEEGTESDYIIDFSGIIDSKEKPYDSDFDVYKDGTVTIAGKEYKYYIDNSAWKAILSYTIPNEKKDLIIEVNGSDVFDSEGNQAKHLATIDEDVLNSVELAGVLNYTVTK